MIITHVQIALLYSFHSTEEKKIALTKKRQLEYNKDDNIMSSKAFEKKQKVKE